MWSVDERELKPWLFGGGGENLARFVDRLIRAEAHLGGLSQDQIHTQVSQNIRDGGVDTCVAAAVPRDGSGWLSEPTCWQYKACEVAKTVEANLRKEIGKAHAKQLIEQGYGYRLCIANGLPNVKRLEWEAVLLAEAQSTNPNGSPPRVVALDKIAAWVSHMPMIVSLLKQLPPGLEDIDAWGKNARSLTREYVPVKKWESVCDDLRRHIDFAQSPGCRGSRARSEARML